MFQSTHPHGVRQRVIACHSQLHSFNPRTRMGCDSEPDVFFQPQYVSIHAPAWGATHYNNAFMDWFNKFQSTHPHGVRHLSARLDTSIAYVSIHAPAWGATSVGELLPVSVIVSIHAPAWGATKIFLYMSSTFGFQSTHPHGVRPDIEKKLYQPNQFQSTHPHGVRLSNKLITGSMFQFQSTHPHGVRRRNTPK